LAASVGKLASLNSDGLGPTQFLVTALAGGTASMIGGGKFGNGAVTAAFGYLLNQLSTHRGDPGDAMSPDSHPARGRSDLPGDRAGLYALGGLMAGTATVGGYFAASYELATAAQLGREALIGTSAGTTVLGSWPDYLNRARVLGAHALNVPNHLFRAVGERAWKFNEAFLNRSIAGGDSFVFSNNANLAREGTFFWREIQHLRANGYQIAKDGLSAYRR
jgi:hypothetical protein